MEIYEGIGLGLTTGLSCAIPCLIYETAEGIKLALAGNYAIKAIEQGDDPRNHRWAASDIRLSLLGKTFIGRSKLDKLEKLVEPQTE